MTVSIEFCGELHHVSDGASFSIGRDGDLQVDENPFLHRKFLLVSNQSGFWILSNVGDRLTATVSDPDGQMEAFLAPGSTLPLVFARTKIAFTAGSTSYELFVANDQVSFRLPPVESIEFGQTTLGPTRLTPDQRRLILALAEPQLMGGGRGPSSLPANKVAARRLDWSITRFNRKLDNVCQKLAGLGVSGLHGAPGDLASNRRARLVEYALATRLVSITDLALLDQPGDD